jgi:hypothetical protein
MEIAVSHHTSAVVVGLAKSLLCAAEVIFDLLIWTEAILGLPEWAEAIFGFPEWAEVGRMLTRHGGPETDPVTQRYP